MALDPNLWDGRHPFGIRHGVSDEEFQAFEKRCGVELPAFLKAMYRIQNGGRLRDVEEIETLLPLGSDYGGWMIPMCSVQELAERGLIIGAIYLDYLEEEFGDTRRLIVVGESYGHVIYFLNYNDLEDDEEPELIRCDNEGGDGEWEADSYEEWIEKLTASETSPNVDWEEREQYPVLFQSAFDATSGDDDDDGEERPCRIEQVLCAAGEVTLILFTRTCEGEKVVGLERAAFPNGVREGWGGIREYRGEPVRTVMVHLEPSDAQSLYWRTSKLKSDGNWRTEESERIPVAAMLESTDKKKLTALMKRLKKEGYLRDAPAVEMPPEFQGLQDMAQMLLQQLAGQQESSEKEQEVPPVTLKSLQQMMQGLLQPSTNEQESIEKKREGEPLASVENTGNGSAGELLEAAGRVADLLGRMMERGSLGEEKEALEKALQEFADLEGEFRAGGSGVLAMWATSPAKYRLFRNWDKLRTRYRDLYREHQDMFQVLEERLG